MTADPASRSPLSSSAPAAALSAEALAAPLSADALAAALRAIGEQRYHHLHPFNLRMHAGTLDRRALKTWVANRYYYQTRIPIKDGLILTKSPEASFRREWVQRIKDHDGEQDRVGGLELWLVLAEAVGLERSRVERLEGVLPGVRRACDAYVEFVNGHDLLESVAASLTELFAGFIMHTRIAAFEKHYSWVAPEGLAYFNSRTTQAPKDSKYGLAYVTEHAKTRHDQERCLAALRRKCEILWQLLDAVERATSRPRLVRHALVRTESDGTQVVVLAERALRLGGSGREILSLLDGERTGSDVAAAMRAAHARGVDATGNADATDAAHSADHTAGAARIEDDVHDFLERLHVAGALRFEPVPPDEADRPGATEPT